MMIKQLLFRMMAVALLMSAVACSNTEPLLSDGQKTLLKSDSLTYLERVSLLDDYKMSEQAVLESVKKFGVWSAAVTSKAAQDSLELKIASKENLSLADFSRGSQDAVGTNDTVPVYYVEMKNGKHNGYAVVSGDLRTSRILAFVPDTIAKSEMTYEQYWLTTLFKKAGENACLKQVRAFNECKEPLRKSAQKKMLSQSRSTAMEAWELKEMEWEGWKLEWSNKKFPELSVTWDQDYPYNCKLPQMGCTDPSYDYRCPAGCGVVAIAHALAYYEPKMSINGQQVDWKMLKKQPYISYSASTQLKNQVGFLMKWIGEKAQAQYTCAETTTHDAIGNVLNLVGMSCDGNSDFDINKIIDSINQGHLVEASGAGHVKDEKTGEELDKVAGHSWIIDGYVIATIDDVSQNVHDRAFYVHNCLGWNGKNDGFYLLDDGELSFDTDAANLKMRLKIHTNIRKK